MPPPLVDCLKLCPTNSASEFGGRRVSVLKCRARLTPLFMNVNAKVADTLSVRDYRCQYGRGESLCPLEFVWPPSVGPLAPKSVDLQPQYPCLNPTPGPTRTGRRKSPPLLLFYTTYFVTCPALDSRMRPLLKNLPKISKRVSSREYLAHIDGVVAPLHSAGSFSDEKYRGVFSAGAAGESVEQIARNRTAKPVHLHCFDSLIPPFATIFATDHSVSAAISPAVPCPSSCGPSLPPSSLLHVGQLVAGCAEPADRCRYRADMPIRGVRQCSPCR
jgi:hypothetical protein